MGELGKKNKNKMKFKIGLILICLPFLVYGYIMAQIMGFRTLLAALAASAFFLGCMAGGLYLMIESTRKK